MSQPDRLFSQSNDRSVGPRALPAVTNWAEVRRQLLLVHPAVRQIATQAAAEIACTEERLPDAIHRAIESVFAITEATGRNIDAAIATGLDDIESPRQFMFRLSALLRNILCVGNGDIQMNATADSDRAVPIFCLRIVGTGLEVSDDARVSLNALAHETRATTSIISTKTECAIAINIPLTREPASNAATIRGK